MNPINLAMGYVQDHAEAFHVLLDGCLLAGVIVAIQQFRHDIRSRRIDSSIRLIDIWTNLLDRDGARKSLDKMMAVCQPQPGEPDLEALKQLCHSLPAAKQLDEANKANHELYKNCIAILNMFEQIAYFYDRGIGDRVFLAENFARPIVRYMAALSPFIGALRGEDKLSAKLFDRLTLMTEKWRKMDWNHFEATRTIRYGEKVFLGLELADFYALSCPQEARPTTGG